MTWYQDEDGNTFEIPDEAPEKPKGFLDSISSMFSPDTKKDIYLDPNTQEFTDRLPEGYVKEDSTFDSYSRSQNASLYDTASGLAGFGALATKGLDTGVNNALSNFSDPYAMMGAIPGVAPIAEVGRQVYDYFSPQEQKPKEQNLALSNPYLQSAHDYLTGVGYDYANSAAQERDAGAMDTSGLGGYALDGAATTAGKIPGVVSKIALGGGPIGAAAIYGAEGAGQKYLEYLKAGDPNAATSATGAGLVDATLGYVIPSQGRNLLRSASLIGAGTFASIAGQSGVDEYVRSATEKDPTKTDYEWGNVLSNAWKTAKKSGPDLLANIIGGKLVPTNGSSSNIDQKAVDSVVPQYDEVPSTPLALEYKGYDTQQAADAGQPIAMGETPGAPVSPMPAPQQVPDLGASISESMSPSIQNVARQLRESNSPLADVIPLEQPSKLTPVEHVQSVDLVDPTGRSLVEPEAPKKIITAEDLQGGYKKIAPEVVAEDRSTPVVALSENMARAKTDALDSTSKIIAEDVQSRFPQKMSEESILDPYGNQLKSRENSKALYESKVAEIQGETRRKLDPDVAARMDTGELPEAKGKAISRVFPLAPEMDAMTFGTKVKRVEEIKNKLDPLTAAEMKEQTRLESEISSYTKTKENPINKTLQLRMLDEVRTNDLSPTQIRDLGAVVKRVSQIENLQADPFVVAKNIKNYETQISEFKKKADTKNAYLKGIDTKKYKSIIEDEIASAIDPYQDRELLLVLSQGQEISPADLSSLAKRRIVAKQRQITPLYKDSPKASFNPNNEKGSVINPIEAMKAVKENILNVFDRPQTFEEAEKIKAKAIKDGTYKPTEGDSKAKELDSADQFLKGLLFGNRMSYVSDAVGAVRKFYTKALREKGMDKTGRYEANYNLYRDFLSKTGEYATNLNQHLVDVVSLSETSRAKVEKYVYGVRNASVKLMKEGKKIQETPESLAKSGLNQEEIRAVNGIRKFADEALSMYQKVADSLIESSGMNVEEQAVAKVKFSKLLQERRDSLYVPAERSGKYVVYGFNEKTQEKYYSRTDSKSEAEAIAKNLKDSGFGDNPPREYRQIAGEGQKYLPEEMKLDLMSLIKDPSAGKDQVLTAMKAHMLNFNAIPGKTIPLMEALVNYSSNMAYSTAQGETMPKMRRVMGENMKIQDPQKRKAELLSYQSSEIFKQHNQWLEDAWKPEGELGRKVRLAVAHHTLGFNNPRPALMNVVGGIVMTIPEIIKLPGMNFAKAHKAYAGAIGRYLGDYAIKSADGSTKMEKSNPELYAALRKAELGGFITGDATSLNEQIRRGALNKGSLTPEKVSFAAQSMGELLLRGPAFVVGYENAPKGKDPYYFALDFVEKTQTDSRKFASPRWARGNLRFASALKSYPHQYWANVFEDVQTIAGSKMYPGVNKVAAAKAFATRAGYGMLAGGIKAVPFMGEFLYALGAISDEDPMWKIKKATEMDRPWYGITGNDAYYMITHGPMSQLLGGTLSSSFSVDKTYDLTKDLGEVALNIVGGAPVSLVRNSFKNATETYKNTDGNLTRALLQAAPSTIRNIGTSYLDSQSGFSLDRKGRVLGEAPTDPYSQFLSYSGVQPKAVTMKQEAASRIRNVDTKASKTFDNLKNSLEFLYKELGNTPEFNDRVIEIRDEYLRQGVPERDVRRRFSVQAINKLKKEFSMDKNKLAASKGNVSSRPQKAEILGSFSEDDMIDSLDNLD